MWKPTMGSVFTEESKMHTPHHLLPESGAHRCQEAPRTWHLEAQPGITSSRLHLPSYQQPKPAA